MTGVPPIFILAPPRSFASIVCAILGQHPGLLGAPDLNLFFEQTMAEWSTGWRNDDTRAQLFPKVLREGLLRFVAQLYAGEQSVEAVEMATRWVRARSAKSTAEVYRELCAACAPRRLVDKSPGYVGRWVCLERMAEAFPDAGYIHLLRHPRSQGQSILDRPGGALMLMLAGSVDRSGPQPIADPQILWHDAQVRIMRFLDQIEPTRWLRIRGERLLGNPDRGMDAICRKFSLSRSRAAIEAMTHPERSPFAAFGPANAPLGDELDFLGRSAPEPNYAQPQSLDGPLAWRPDGAGFHPRVATLARRLGYA